MSDKPPPPDLTTLSPGQLCEELAGRLILHNCTKATIFAAQHMAPSFFSICVTATAAAILFCCTAACSMSDNPPPPDLTTLSPGQLCEELAGRVAARVKQRLMGGDPWAQDPICMDLPGYRQRYYEVSSSCNEPFCVSSIRVFCATLVLTVHPACVDAKLFAWCSCFFFARHACVCTACVYRVR